MVYLLLRAQSPACRLPDVSTDILSLQTVQGLAMFNLPPSQFSNYGNVWRRAASLVCKRHHTLVGNWTAAAKTTIMMIFSSAWGGETRMVWGVS
eukprot:286237-Rhodomonas_salina.1